MVADGADFGPLKGDRGVEGAGQRQPQVVLQAPGLLGVRGHGEVGVGVGGVERDEPSTAAESLGDVGEDQTPRRCWRDDPVVGQPDDDVPTTLHGTSSARRLSRHEARGYPSHHPSSCRKMA